MITEVKTKVYAGRLKDRASLLRSSSGGAFVALSDCFLDNGDAVVCAVYNYEDHATEFQLIENREERDKSIGSKYMQSKPGKIYKIAEDWLINHPEKRLLFVGMGCQADGFRKFAEMKGFRERVWIVDIICHGSPSPRLWKEYAESAEKKYGKITYLTFKDKRNGWKAPTAYVTAGGQEHLIKDYVKVFYNQCALRLSCYECPYAQLWYLNALLIGLILILILKKSKINDTWIMLIGVVFFIAGIFVQKQLDVASVNGYAGFWKLYYMIWGKTIKNGVFMQCH